MVSKNSRKILPSGSLSRLRQCTILEPYAQDGKGGRPESSWEQLVRCHARRDCLSLSAMISPQLAKSFRYASCQQFLGPASLLRAFSSNLSPLGSLAPSMAKSPTAPSSSITGARSPPVAVADEEEEEEMFHENPRILTGQTKKQIKISSTGHRFLDMILLVTDLGAGN